MKRKLLLGFVIGGVALWLAVRNIKWHEVSAAFETVSAGPFVLMLIPFLATYWFRARRWRLLLRPIVQIEFKEIFAISTVGFLGINALPFRLGEMIRPMLLKRRHSIPFSTGLATIAVERIFDGLLAAIFMAIGVLSAPTDLGQLPLLGFGLRATAIASIVIRLLSIAFLIIAVWQRQKALDVLRFFLNLVPVRFHQRLDSMAINFFSGLDSLPNRSSLVRIFFESAGVWGTMIITYWLGIVAFHLDLHWSAAFSILGIAAIGVLIPGPPGFAGTFELFVVAALALYGVPNATAFAYAVLIHVWSLLFIGVLGMICLPRVTTKVRDLVAEAAASDLSAVR